MVAVYSGRQPGYQDRTLSEWIEDAGDAGDNSAASYATWQASSEALRQMEKEAVPWLLKWAQTEDSKLGKKIVLWINAHPQLHLHYHLAEERRTDALVGFILLGDRVKEYWPTFVQWTNSKNAMRRWRGLHFLISTNADKQTLLPVLQRLANDPDADLKRDAALALHFQYPHEAEAAGIYKWYPEFRNITTDGNSPEIVP